MIKHATDDIVSYEARRVYNLGSFCVDAATIQESSTR